MRREEFLQETRTLQWERKLLDLSLRNMLISMRFTKSVVPILAEDLAVIEDALSDGEEFKILPRPDNMPIEEGTISVEAMTSLGEFSGYIASEGKHKRLYSLYNEAELTGSLTKLYRSARTSLEENGASTLYLTLGLLRWFDSKKNDRSVRYAPLILVPIDIRRRMVSKGYTMCMRDEDAQLNITLMEFLKQNYGIEIPGLNPLPADEHGLDLKKIFAEIRLKVMDLTDWDVLEAGFVGNFSFSQFVMWNDIHNRTDILERNAIVRSLIKGAIDPDCKILKSADTDEIHLPVAADSSQLRAVNMAAGGVSFVLHGPPGTGKSQTITGMIANALSKGQTVLFVAEKRAALEVVQERLDALGIGDFCLELHSNKATRKSVLGQLKKVLEIEANGAPTDYEQRIQEIREVRSSLDAYAKKLHERRNFGKSLRELMNEYERMPDDALELYFDGGYAFGLSQIDLDLHQKAIAQLIAAGKEVRHPKDHPLKRVGQTEYSRTLKTDFEDAVKNFVLSLEELKEAAGKFADDFGSPFPVSEEDWMKLSEDAKCLILTPEILDFLLNPDALEQNFYYPLRIVREKDELRASKATLLAMWDENFLHLDRNIYYIKYENAKNRLFFKGRAKKNLEDELQAFAKSEVVFEQIPALLAGVDVYTNRWKELDAKQEQLSVEWKQILERYDSESELIAYKNEMKIKLGRLLPIADKVKNLKQRDALSRCMESAQKFLENVRQSADRENVLANRFHLDMRDFEADWMENRMKLCENLLKHSDDLKDWIVYRKARNECENLGLNVVCEAYENGVEEEKIPGIYLRSIYRAIILSVIENEPVLNGFTGTAFNAQIARFKKIDEEFMASTKEEIYQILAGRIPSAYDSVQSAMELNILRRAISSNGRGLSVRSLFDRIPEILPKLSPCMLMSPISVAQFLSANNPPFDIVIFDEASQLQTCKAVGVLARGRNAVIVGDPNQMPPTAFFAGNTVDEDNLEIEDLESILDDCLALGMPSAHLKWHYRSRHESLIAFSNQEFYENSMFTFPSVNDRSQKVRLMKVDGFFDRKKGRINEGEARAIVAEIRRIYMDASLKQQSVGVVTFNIGQQNFIEDLLSEEFRKDMEFEMWANEGDGKLFVKNLENVQGDERDVILFSVAFGPDEDGKLSLNFGPLNKEGGWRRLNVAVTRSRNEMSVFTVMDPDWIDLRRTKSKGVESLKNFLLFAKDPERISFGKERRSDETDSILDSICKELDTLGYEYRKYVGRSKFKLDLAILHPQRQDEYILGVLLDGDSYRQIENVKDREIAQKEVLKGLGWELHRIWIMDWWDNKEKELARLKGILQERLGDTGISGSKEALI